MYRLVAVLVIALCAYLGFAVWQKWEAAEDAREQALVAAAAAQADAQAAQSETERLRASWVSFRRESIKLMDSMVETDQEIVSLVLAFKKRLDLHEENAPLLAGG